MKFLTLLVFFSACFFSIRSEEDILQKLQDKVATNGQITSPRKLDDDEKFKLFHTLSQKVVVNEDLATLRQKRQSENNQLLENLRQRLVTDDNVAVLRKREEAKVAKLFQSVSSNVVTDQNAAALRQKVASQNLKLLENIKLADGPVKSDAKFSQIEGLRKRAARDVNVGKTIDSLGQRVAAKGPVKAELKDEEKVNIFEKLKAKVGNAEVKSLKKRSVAKDEDVAKAFEGLRKGIAANGLKSSEVNVFEKLRQSVEATSKQ